jgi:hypothetical protein
MEQAMPSRPLHILLIGITQSHLETTMNCKKRPIEPSFEEFGSARENTMAYT